MEGFSWTEAVLGYQQINRNPFSVVRVRKVIVMEWGEDVCTRFS